MSQKERSHIPRENVPHLKGERTMSQKERDHIPGEKEPCPRVKELCLKREDLSLQCSSSQSSPSWCEQHLPSKCKRAGKTSIYFVHNATNRWKKAIVNELFCFSKYPIFTAFNNSWSWPVCRLTYLPVKTLENLLSWLSHSDSPCFSARIIQGCHRELDLYFKVLGSELVLKRSSECGSQQLFAADTQRVPFSVL